MESIAYSILDSVDSKYLEKSALHGASEKNRGEIQEWVLSHVRSAVEEEPSSIGKIISIYGIGGQGKSYLLQKLLRRTRSEHGSKASVVFHNFKENQDNPLDRVLKDIALLFVYQGIPCPGFLMTYYAYRSLSANVQIAAREFDEDHRFISQSSPLGQKLRLADFTSPFIDAVFGACGIQIPVGSIVNSVVQTAGDEMLERRRRTAEARWNQIKEQSTASELFSQLAPMLEQDVRAWMESDQEHRLIVFLDTFDRLEKRIESGGGSYRWVRLLSRIPGTLWVIAGRVRVPWYNVIPVPIHLVEMERDEADELLLRAGIADAETRKGIEKLTKCLPVYLELCAQQYRNNPSLPLDKIDWSGTREELLEWFLKYVPEAERKMVHTAAFLESWDYDLLSSIADRLHLEVDLGRINKFSFISENGNEFTMHEVVADVLRRSKRIYLLKQDVYDAIGKMLKDLQADAAMHEDVRARRRNRLLRARCRLLDAGVKDVSRSEAFNEYMAYAEGVRRSGNIDAAMGIFRAIASGFGTDDAPTSEYLRAKLKIGAMSTQFFLDGRGCNHHAHAIVLAEEVLDQARRMLPSDELLIQSALNDLGVSWARFGQYEKALSYQEKLFRQIREKDSAGLSADEARFVNNYGSTCQQYADSLDDSEKRDELYRRAEDAYEFSLDARRRQTGCSSSAALIVQTNLGVVKARLGDYDEARRIVGDARLRYEKAGFDSSTPGFIRCDYQLAMFDETEAGLLAESDAGRALELATRALQLHDRVYQERAKRLSPMSIDLTKSAEQVDRCKELVSKLEEVERFNNSSD